jgi:hypothetical protein
MNSQFHFKNFEPEFQLRFKANLVLNRTLDVAPYGSIGIGLLKKHGENDYCCALDIYSKQGPFIANAVASTPEKALECLEEKMKNQIYSEKAQKENFLQPSSFCRNQALAVS